MSVHALTQAVEQVEPQEDEHLGWATDMRCKMIAAQAHSTMAQAAGEAAEHIVARIKSWLD